MFANHDGALRRHLLISKRWFAMVVMALSLFCAAATLQAQNSFSSGSTGTVCARHNPVDCCTQQRCFQLHHRQHSQRRHNYLHA